MSRVMVRAILRFGQQSTSEFILADHLRRPRISAPTISPHEDTVFAACTCPHSSRLTMSNPFRRTALVSLLLLAAGLPGCLVVPVAPDGRPVALVPAGVSIGARPTSAAPAVLSACLYPTNDIASRSGVVLGQ